MKSRAQRYRYVRHVVSGTRPSPWSPLSLGSSLAAWYKADAGCYTDAACLFASASSQYLSKTSPTFAPTTKMTIRFSVKPTLGAPGQTICSRFDTSDNQFLLYQIGSGGGVSGTLRLYVCSSGADSSNYATTDLALTDGAWNEVVVEYDGTLGAASRVAIYINGVAATMSVSGTIPTSLRASSASLEIGRYSGGSEYYNGALARLGFSSQALSGAALTAAHTSTFWADMTAARQADWFSFYNLCEASGTRVDSTGLNNLTPTNGPTVAAGPGEGAAVNNSPVKRIESQYGAVNLSQSTIANQPLWTANGQNGLPCLVGNGSTQWIGNAAMTVAQPLVMAIVMKHRTGSVAANELGMYGTGAEPVIYCRQSAPDAFAYYAGTEQEGAALDSAWHVHVGTFNGASSSLRLDGSVSSSANPGTGGLTGIAMFSDYTGTAGKMDGSIAEALVVSRAMTAAELTAMESYLRAKWATP